MIKSFNSSPVTPTSRRHAFTSFERMRVFLVFMGNLHLFFICSLDVYQQRTSPHLYDYLKIAEFPHLSNIRQPDWKAAYNKIKQRSQKRNAAFCLSKQFGEDASDDHCGRAYSQCYYAECDHIFFLQYSAIALFTNSAVPSPPALSMFARNLPSAAYICPSDASISAEHS